MADADEDEADADEADADVADADVSVLLQHSTLLFTVKSLLQFTLSCSTVYMFAEDTCSQTASRPTRSSSSFPNKKPNWS